MMIRRASILTLRSIINNIGNIYARSSAASTNAVTAGDLKLLRGAPYSSAANSGSLKRLPSPSNTSRFESLRIAGALAFSLALADWPWPDPLPEEVVLYQNVAWPASNQVRAFLDYHDIPYRVVDIPPVHPFTITGIKWSDYVKIPILVKDGEQLVGSSDIIEKLSQNIHPDDSIDEEETKWRRWVDDHLVHILLPNIWSTTSEGLEFFDNIANNGNFNFIQRPVVKYAGAAAMFTVVKILKKECNITDERAALYEAAETWTRALEGRDFLGGSKPNLADLSVFGVLRPIRYMKAGRDMVENTGIGEWYQRMEAAVGESSQVPLTRDFLRKAVFT